ncbi:hypothetical protein [Rhizobium leguminosarum]|uniref:hypothetical protein n=1 Tax=Rhizobium leguminosarum TaxID=384 RepID=UPI0014417C39|nr:hypothetical protein [Rhizobium leguminosarum]MBY5868784.1 hypothetical protein [Rhizobium leguminosarum]NKM06212.1 hypothetical protein [Rhizobium leguminosarum bv. viciae]
MTFPRIKTITIDSHDETIPVVRFRLVEIAGTNYHLAQDIGHHLGLKASEEGDYRSALVEAGIPFIDLVVFERDQPLGLHALLTEAAFYQARLLKRG